MAQQTPQGPVQIVTPCWSGRTDHLRSPGLSLQASLPVPRQQARSSLHTCFLAGSKRLATSADGNFPSSPNDTALLQSKEGAAPSSDSHVPQRS